MESFPPARRRVPFSEAEDTLVRAYYGRPGGLAILIKMTGRDRRTLADRSHRLTIGPASPSHESERDRTLAVYEALCPDRGRTADELAVRLGYAVSTITVDLRHLARGKLARQDGDIWYRVPPEPDRRTATPQVGMAALMIDGRGRQVNRKGKGTA